MQKNIHKKNKNINSTDELETVDLRGYDCPIAMVKASSIIKEFDYGTKIKLLGDENFNELDFKLWLDNSGNKIINSNGNEYLIEIGKGYKANNVVEYLEFIILGIKLHIKKIFFSIFKKNYFNYLITFSSINDGLNADRFLIEKKYQGW